MVFIAPGSSPQIVFQLLVTVLSVVVLNSLTPYIERAHNLLAVLAQWAIFGIALVTLLIKINRSSLVAEYDQNALDTFMIVIFFIVPVVCVVLVLIQISQAYRIVCFCVDWDRFFDSHPRLSRPVRRNFMPTSGNDDDSRLGTSFQHQDDEAVMEKQPARQSMVMLEKLALETVAHKPHKLEEAESMNEKWKETFELAKAEWESELNQQTRRANKLQLEREQLFTRTEMLEDELKSAMIRLKQQESRNDMGPHLRVTEEIETPPNPIFARENTVEFKRTGAFETSVGFSSRNLQ